MTLLSSSRHQLSKHILQLSSRNNQKAVHQHRLSSFSSTYNSDGLVLTTINEDDGIAMLTMNRPPANSLNLQMNEAISTSIKDIESNPKIQSVILTSTNPKIFSAGLDVSELVNPDIDRLPLFWNSLQQVYIELYGSRLATIGVIQGHAPAAGCFLAMACDYRLMCAGDEHVPCIGLNETKLGIAAPPWMGQLMVRTIGTRKAELALALGTLFPPKEALKVGLVDEVVSHAECESNDILLELLPATIKDQSTSKIMQQAYAKAKTFVEISPQARMASKMLTREEYIQAMVDTREADTEHFCTFVKLPAVQKSLTAYVEAMKKGKKK